MRWDVFKRDCLIVEWEEDLKFKDSEDLYANPSMSFRTFLRAPKSSENLKYIEMLGWNLGISCAFSIS